MEAKNCYKDMYYKLFNKITDIIEELQGVQVEAEEMFMAHNPPDEDLK